MIYIFSMNLFKPDNKSNMLTLNFFKIFFNLSFYGRNIILNLLNIFSDIFNWI